MNRKVFSLCLGTVLFLLASCSGGYSSKEIDGVEFTGKGVFGDVPYICMDFLKEFNGETKEKAKIETKNSKMRCVMEKHWWHKATIYQI